MTPQRPPHDGCRCGPAAWFEKDAFCPGYECPGWAASRHAGYLLASSQQVFEVLGYASATAVAPGIGRIACDTSSGRAMALRRAAPLNGRDGIHDDRLASHPGVVYGLDQMRAVRSDSLAPGFDLVEQVTHGGRLALGCRRQQAGPELRLRSLPCPYSPPTRQTPAWVRSTATPPHRRTA